MVGPYNSAMCCLSTFRDIDELTTAVTDSQKIFDINPWDFEPDFSPATGKFAANACFMVSFQLAYSLSYRITIIITVPSLRCCDCIG